MKWVRADHASPGLGADCGPRCAGEVAASVILAPALPCRQFISKLGAKGPVGEKLFNGEVLCGQLQAAAFPSSELGGLLIRVWMGSGEQTQQGSPGWSSVYWKHSSHPGLL